ncbi:MAG TPA: hypothetical protein VJA21_31920, partial [Verrucomicrobiae bacterium]
MKLAIRLSLGNSATRLARSAGGGIRRRRHLGPVPVAVLSFFLAFQLACPALGQAAADNLATF